MSLMMAGQERTGVSGTMMTAIAVAGVVHDMLTTRCNVVAVLKGGFAS